MWLWGQKKKAVVSISLSPQHISCCLAQQNDQDTKKITISAYERKNFRSLEFEKSIVFNPTTISRHIKQFIKKNKVEKPIASLSISGPNIFEKIVTLSKSTPQKTDFSFPELQNTSWNHTYLCPSTKSGFHFYIHSIPKEILFQYKLLAIQSGIQLRTVTTETNACLQLYKYIKDKNFTQNQFAIDLSENHFDIQSICTTNLLKEKIVLQKNLKIKLKNELPFVPINAGLFLVEEK